MNAVVPVSRINAGNQYNKCDKGWFLRIRCINNTSKCGVRGYLRINKLCSQLNSGPANIGVPCMEVHSGQCSTLTPTMKKKMEMDGNVLFWKCQESLNSILVPPH